MTMEYVWFCLCLLNDWHVVIILTQYGDLGEYDIFSKFSYTCNQHQGSKSIIRTYILNYQVRVFHSSKLSSEFSPTPILVVKRNGSLKEKTSYRYDGLYMVMLVFDRNGMTIKGNSLGTDIGLVTFLFTRVHPWRCVKPPTYM